MIVAVKDICFEILLTFSKLSIQISMDFFQNLLSLTEFRLHGLTIVFLDESVEVIIIHNGIYRLAWHIFLHESVDASVQFLLRHDWLRIRKGL